jgi:two-component system response regulator ArlR
MKMNENILLIEDDLSHVRFIKLELQHEGYDVETANDGRTGLLMANNKKTDLILLDIMLPEMNGIEVCQRIRQFSSVPIIMLTAKSDITDKVIGLDIGANDYVTKPFEIVELLARIRAALRSTNIVSETSKAYQIADLTMDTSKHEVRRNEQIIYLTKTEYDLLEYFIKNKEIVLSREKILENVWGYDYSGDTNTVDVFVSYLRAKVDDSYDVKLIHTVRGVGYVIKVAKYV